MYVGRRPGEQDTFGRQLPLYAPPVATCLMYSSTRVVSNYSTFLWSIKLSLSTNTVAMLSRATAIISSKWITHKCSCRFSQSSDFVLHSSHLSRSLSDLLTPSARFHISQYSLSHPRRLLHTSVSIMTSVTAPVTKPTIPCRPGLPTLPCRPSRPTTEGLPPPHYCLTACINT